MRVERKVMFGVLGALTLLSIISVFSYLSVLRLLEGFERVRHAQITISRIENILMTVTDWESAQRGYILTGNEEFLRPQKESLAKLEAEHAGLLQAGNLPGLDSSLHPLLTELEELVRARLDQVDHVITVRREQGFEAAQRIVAAGQGKALHDRIREVCAELREAEAARMRERDLEAQDAAKVARYVILGSSGLAFSFMGCGIFLVRRDFAGRRLEELQLRESNVLLEERVADRTRELETTNRDLRESAGLLRTVSDGARVGLVLVSAEHRYLFANQTYSEMLGLKGQNVIGKLASEVFPEHYERVAARLNRAFQGHSDSYDTVMTVDGVECTFMVSYEPQMENGQVRSVVIVVADITAQKRGEEILRYANEMLEERVAERTAELREAKERAEAADRTKSQFLASMSHELRTPLNAIIGFTGTLIMGLPGPLTKEQRRQLEMVRASARHQLSLINDLLDLAKIEAGKVQLRMEEVDCTDLLEEVTATLRPMAEHKGLALHLQLPESRVTLLSDRRSLQQILTNLLNNAIKFTREGSVTLKVECNGEVFFHVRDTGSGIRPEDQVKLFRAFGRVESPGMERQEGTGLGLHLSSKLAELLEGSISLQSIPGEGSTFTLVLPRQAVSDRT